MTVTEFYDIDFGGQPIADGDKKVVVAFSPFESPEIRVSDTVRGQQDGLFPGIDYYGARTIPLEIEIWGDDSAPDGSVDFSQAYQSILQACVLSREEKPLEFRIPGYSTNLVVNARCRKVSGLIINQQFDHALATVVLQFVATDPRIYSATEQSSTVQFTGTQPGRAYSLTFNRNYGGVVASNEINATNSGSYEAPWEAVITGPVTNPTIEHADLGLSIRLVGTINDGEFIVISSAPYQTIMLNGTASRYSLLANASQWFMLRPGSNRIRFNGTSTGTPTMTLTWRSAWA